MPRMMFAEIKKNRVILTDLAGAPQLSAREGNVILLSRLDCAVVCLGIPHVSERDRDALIRYRMRSVYPGRLENALLDHVIQRKGRKTVAVAAIVDRETMARYRGAAPRAVFSLLSVALLTTNESRRDRSIVHWSTGYVEVMRFDSGVLLESTVIKRSRPAVDAVRIARLLASHDDARPPLVLAMGKELPALAGHLHLLARSGTTPETKSVESIEFPRRTPRALFQPRPRFSAPRPAVARSILALLAALIFAASFLRYLDFRERELAELRRAVAGSQMLDRRQAELVVQLEALKVRMASLARDRPEDVCRLLSDLRSTLGPEVTIQDIVVRNRSFQFQGTGARPLVCMQRFTASPRFSDVRLLQTTPVSGTGQQRFIVTGKHSP